MFRELGTEHILSRSKDLSLITTIIFYYNSSWYMHPSWPASLRA